MEKHTKPELNDFKAIVTDIGCIKITISDELDLTDASIKILGENRNFLIELTNLDNITEFCTYTGKPMFIELHTPTGMAVHYIEGSGKDFYKNLSSN